MSDLMREFVYFFGVEVYCLFFMSFTNNKEFISTIDIILFQIDTASLFMERMSYFSFMRVKSIKFRSSHYGPIK